MVMLFGATNVAQFCISQQSTASPQQHQR